MVAMPLHRFIRKIADTSGEAHFGETHNEEIKIIFIIIEST